MLYLVKDGVKDVGYVSKNGKQLFDTNFYLITYDFKTNEGYFEKKHENVWRLYTQVGQKVGQGRYHELTSFDQCVEKLKELKGDDKILICNADEIGKYKL